MKTFTLLFFTIGFFISTAALAKGAELRFQSASHERIQLIINGRLVNKYPAEEVYVQERPGRHRIKLRVFNRVGRLKLEHYDQIHVRPHTKNGFVLESHPYHGSRLLQLNYTPIHERPVLRNPKAPKPYKPRLTIISDEDFFRLKDVLSLQATDRARMKVAQKRLRHQQLYARDIEELLYLFDYENSRLAFATWTYSRVVDPENYEEVYPAFRYEASIIQLQNRLRHR